jgi:putative ABC transport system substrate-binding protein
LKARGPAAASLGLRLSLTEFTPHDQTSAFALIKREPPDAVVVQPSGFASGKRDVLADFAIRQRLPLMTSDRMFVEAGALISYSPSGVEMNRLTAEYVDRILRGAKPGDLSIQQATTFELAVNVKTAAAIGVTFPAAFLQRPDIIRLPQ